MSNGLLGKDKWKHKLSARRLSGVFRCGLAAAVLMSLSGCENFRSPVPTPAPEPTLQLTANEVAEAMQDDSFFSNYGSSILLVRGEISSVEQQGTFTVVGCELTAQK